MKRCFIWYITWDAWQNLMMLENKTDRHLNYLNFLMESLYNQMQLHLREIHQLTVKVIKRIFIKINIY